VSVFYKI